MQFLENLVSQFDSHTFVDLLRSRAEHEGDQPAFIYLADGELQENRMTYGQLDARARAIGAYLTQMGMTGERALLIYPPGLDFIAAFFGCLYAGVVAVPAYPPRRNRKLTRIEMIADDAEAKVGLATKAVIEQVQSVMDETPDLKKIAWVATDALPEGLDDRWRHPNVRGDSIAFLQYTSGSTGAPKGVMLTHRNLMHNSAQICYAFEHTRSGGGVFWLPSYHDMGLIGGILQPLFIGRPNVLMSPMSFLQKPFRWLSAISRYKATSSGGPNFAYELCVDKITEEQKAELDLSNWCVAFNGAEPVRGDTLDRFTKAFASCGFRAQSHYPCFGLAEATLLVTGGYKLEMPVVRWFDAKAIERHEAVGARAGDPNGRALVSSGSSLLDSRVVIADPDSMTQSPPGRIGEIWVSGPSVAKGYWKKPEATEYTFHAYLKDTGDGPFMRTGDLGFIADGELFVTGRLKDLIIIRGRNHYPQDIEETIAACHPKLRPDSVAAFVFEAAGKQRLGVVAEVARKGDQIADELFHAIRKAVSSEHELVVDAIALVKLGGIPKTSSGKIQRHLCRADMVEGSLEAIAKWSTMPFHAAAQIEASETAAAAHGSTTNGAPKPSAASTGDSVQQSTIETVMDHVRRVAKERAAGLIADSNIVELGLDSLERLEIIASLQETFGGRLPDEVLPEIETCREVAQAIEKYLGTERATRKSIPDDQPIPQEYCQFAKFPEYVQLKNTMTAMDDFGLENPFFKVHEGLTADTTLINGREMINFSSFNYLGTSGDPAVSQAAKEAIEQYGTSVSASRLVSGEKSLHRELERAIADFVGAQDAIVGVGGHSTNESTIGHLFGPGDLILHDALAHNSILQGSVLSGARRRSIPHNDYEALDNILAENRRQYRRVLVVIEGVYSMDGDIAPLPGFIEVKRRHDAFLMVDEAHSLGVLGPHGRGVGEHFEIDTSHVDLWMGTLSKSLGSCGGYIAGTKELVEYLKYTSPGFVYSVGLTPPNAAAALASLRLIEEEPDRVGTLIDRSSLFLKLAKEKGLNTGKSSGTPVIPIITGSSTLALELSKGMADEGVNVQPILYPAVEDSAARLRFFITSKHSEEQIRYTVDALARQWGRLTGGSKRPASEGAEERRSTQIRTENSPVKLR